MKNRFIGMGGMQRMMIEAQLAECQRKGISIVVIDPKGDYLRGANGAACSDAFPKAQLRSSSNSPEFRG
ncbi:hypothetical protein [Paenibacillus validus]|uniref:hypothetical protein n=1 Tax=Paenibacillus validus TaxID=44253 RepID=UPI003D28C3A9